MNSASVSLATALVASILLSDYGLVEAERVSLKAHRGDTLTREHAWWMRQQGASGHQLGTRAGKKMIYPQSMTNRVARWFGLYGTVANANDTPVTMTNTLDITWTGNLLLADDEQSVPVIFDTASDKVIVEGCTASCTAGL